MIYFVDDLNMPMLDPYNTQQPIALMRQHVDYGHWYVSLRVVRNIFYCGSNLTRFHRYDRAKLSYQNIRVIQNTQYITAMNPTAGSFHINPRLQRHFAVCVVRAICFRLKLFNSENDRMSVSFTTDISVNMSSPYITKDVSNNNNHRHSLLISRVKCR